MYDLANKYNFGILMDESVVKMDDRSLFTMLSMVKGIGSWLVHMFMIFSLHRPDVLPVSDLGVRKGVQLLYSSEDLPRPSQMKQLCEKWKSYISVGASYMWRYVEGKGTPAAGATMAGERNELRGQVGRRLWWRPPMESGPCEKSHPDSTIVTHQQQKKGTVEEDDDSEVKMLSISSGDEDGHGIEVKTQVGR
ncbi:probable DNA-3-methyladenine glycosylase 2 isoform X2 [Olea europaea subsp. europaea]|uniref:Probable DNA-3-methyladenine glycosylase 2 isoform X2 n=1 Tax=Olea europaea subsp. europaea TaxID=158383 RepID=A0A8S0UGM2_OLEEU|nr:probable DNA-3-methyladenine glycosylase 2 isoform X2 [Olea europaea subsp. europaea]